MTVGHAMDETAPPHDPYTIYHIGAGVLQPKAEECGVRPRLKTATFYNILYDVCSTPVITD